MPELTELFADQLNVLFPFHIGCDADLQITQLGPQASLISGLVPGAPLESCLKILRPSFTRGPAEIRRRRNVTFLLQDRAGLRLRGQVICCAEGPFLFLVIPWFTDLTEAHSFGINPISLPPHDATREFMYALQLQKRAVAEASQMQDMLERQNSVLTSQFDATQDGVLIEDSQQQIITCNRRFWKVWGLPTPIKGATETLPIWAEIAQHATAPVEFQAELDRVHSDPLATSEVVVNLRDGRILECNTLPIERHSGLLYGRSWHFRDVTVQHQAREEIVRARQLAEHSVSLKAEFLACMSHELRSPLHALVSTIDLLQATQLDQGQQDILSVLSSSGAHLRSLIDDLLDFSKIEAGKMHLASDVFAPARVLQDVTQLFAAAAKQKKLLLSAQVEPPVPDWVCADEVRIRQILLNFLSNAVKFTSFGEIHVSLGARPSSAGWELHFSVQDSGPGISADHLPLLFQPFTQADSSRTRLYQGTGLGLAICKQLAELMGGSTWVHSELGHGSTFHCIVQVAPASPLQKCASRSATPRPFHLRILVVDDVEANRFVAKLQLEALGCSVTVAESGVEALRFCAQQPFDLIFMDIQMPGIDGFETTRLMRETCDSPPRVVAVTASLDDEVRRMAALLGMSGAISKPWRAAELVSVLEGTVRLAEMATNYRAVADDIDWVGLRDLGMEGKLDDLEVAEVIRSYCGTATELLAGIAADVSAKDIRSLARKAHTLKGSSAMVGATRLAELAGHLESAAKQDDHERCLSLNDQITQCGLSTVDALQQYFSRGV